MGQSATGCQDLDIESTSGRSGYGFGHVYAEAGEGDACTRHRYVKRCAGAVDARRKGGRELDVYGPGKSVQRLNLYLKKSAAAPFDGLGVIKKRQRKVRCSERWRHWGCMHQWSRNS